MKRSLEIDTPMTPEELRASASLSSIYMLRMLGLFMILPVFSIYARNLADSTPFLIGLAISAYGLTQAILGIPFGLWSDRSGRKKVIAIGLLIFAAGSVLAAVSDSIYGVIAGRAIQGSGAIAAVVMALVADLTREEHRTKAMAFIGASIGVSFALSMVAGPILSGWVGVKGIFWIIAGLALAGIAVLYLWAPKPKVSRFHRDAQAQPRQFSKVLKNPELLRLDYGIFTLHMILTATFVAVPLILRDVIQFDTALHWQIYLPVFALSLISMVPFIILAETKQKMKPVFIGFILILVVADCALAVMRDDLYIMAFLLYLFFTGFNLLEAALPSLVSKIAPPDLKGTAMGVYSTAQFLGAFSGGIGGGLIYGSFGLHAVFIFCAVAALIWAFIAFGMKQPNEYRTLMIHIDEKDQAEADRLSQSLLKIPGIVEAIIWPEDGTAYLKVDKKRLDKESLEALLFQNETP